MGASAVVTDETVVAEAEAGAPDLAPILAAARAGEARAQEELYRRFAGVVHGIVVARVGARDADDLAQEAFALVFRGLGSVRSPAALPSWICTIARNIATDHGRRAKRAPAREPLDDVPDRARGDDAAELRARVLARIRELPDAYRETLVLRLVEGLSGPEIAERTGLGAASVRVNLCRGLAMLRPLLEREGWS